MACAQAPPRLWPCRRRRSALSCAPRSLVAAAPEFYDNLAVCDSWIGVIWDYIVREDVGPYNRVKRKSTKED